MKFLKNIVSIIVVISILVCIPSVSFSQSMGYSEKYDRILHRIEELCEYANLIAEINTIMWQKDGPEKIGNDINIMLSLFTSERLRVLYISLYNTMHKDDFV